MAVFQFCYSLRPLILAMFSSEEMVILTEYRIIEVFNFIISIEDDAKYFCQNITAIQNNDRRTIERIAYEGTKYTSILVAYFAFRLC